jgi:diguanylate cyclase (GGDEF)-like protein
MTGRHAQEILLRDTVLVSKRFPPLAALARALFPYLLWPLVAASLALVLWVSTDTKLAGERAQAEQHVAAAAESAAAGFAQYLGRSLDQMDQLTMQLKYEWERGQDRPDLAALHARGLFTSNQFADVAILGPDGARRSSLRVHELHASAAERSLLRWHHDHISSALYITAPADGGPLLFSRRLDTPDDDFDGVVVIAVDRGYFLDYYDPMVLGRGGLLAIADENGAVLAERSGGEHALLAPGVPLPHPSSAALRLDGFADHAVRFTAVHALAAYPLTVAAAVPLVESVGALAPRWRWYRQLRWTGCAALACAGAALVLHQRRRRALRKVRAGYRLATEGGEEGFYMLRPERRDGCIVDCTVLDCNERGAALFGLARNDVLGRRLSSLHLDGECDRLLSVCEQCFALGSWREEVPFRAHAAGPVQWVRRKVVVSGAELAVTLRDISAAKASEQALQEMARTDSLTGLLNRAACLQELAATLARPGCGDCAVLFVDLDGFKSVNDAHGHSAGDMVLREASQRLRRALRPGDWIARLGGDEFTVVLPRAGRAEAERVGARLLQVMAEPYPVERSSADLGASIGISLYPEHGRDADTLIRHADLAMYAAKGDGKGRLRVFEDRLSELFQQRYSTERDLRLALRKRQFEVHYQPRVDAGSGALLGAEALVRWRHPERGLLAPGAFIADAERSGLIVGLGAQVLDLACAQMACWRTEDGQIVPLSVNVSAMQFQQPDFVATVEGCLRRHGIAPELLELEITESAMLGEDAAVMARLQALRRLGVRTAVDDFGTGYSSLAQLQRLDVDILKVDRMFTQALTDAPDSHVLYRAIVSMAHALGLRVVAEGVETELQAGVLRGLGCDELQGFLVARPLPASDFRAGFLDTRLSA